MASHEHQQLQGVKNGYSYQHRLCRCARKRMAGILVLIGSISAIIVDI